VAEALRTAVSCEPLVAWLPDQAPEAMHEEAFLAAQVSVALVPLAMLLGEALKLTTGAAAPTETVTD
jgi:hypothetical protein